MKVLPLIVALMVVCMAISGCLVFDRSLEFPSPVVSASGSPEAEEGSHLPPVTGLHAETLDSRSVKLSWNLHHGSHPSVYGYEVNIDSPNQDAIPDFPAQGGFWWGSHYVYDLQPETLYTFTVRAVGDGEKGPTSDPVSNTTLPEVWLRHGHLRLVAGGDRGGEYELGLHRPPDPGQHVDVDLDWDREALDVSRSGENETIERIRFDEHGWTTTIRVVSTDGAEFGHKTIGHIVNTTSMGRDEAFDVAHSVRAMVWVEPVRPERVEGLHAQAVNSTSVRLEWDNPEDPARVGFLIHAFSIPDIPAPPVPPVEDPPPEDEHSSTNSQTSIHFIETDPFWGWTHGDSPPTIKLDDPDTSEYVVDQLNPRTSYRFHVATITTDNVASFSRSDQATTKETPVLHIPSRLIVREGGETTYRANLSTPSEWRDFSWTLKADSPNVTIEPDRIQFAPETSSIPITVRAPHDEMYTGNESITITHQFDPEASANDTPRSLQSTLGITRVEMDQAGVLIQPPRLGVQDGSTATFTVQPQTRPVEGKIVLDLDTENEPRMKVSPQQLVFNDDTWRQPQNVTVRSFPGASLTSGQGSIGVQVAPESSQEYTHLPKSSVAVIFIPAAAPDIQLQLHVHPERPKAGEIVELQISVFNNSTLTLDGPELIISIGNHPIHNTTIRKLSPGDTMNLTHSLPAVDGEYLVRATIQGFADNATRVTILANGNGTRNPMDDFQISENTIPGPGILVPVAIALLVAAKRRRRR